MSKSLGSFYSKALLGESASTTTVELWSSLLADNESELLELSINKAFLLSRVETTQPSRVRIYTSSTSRDSDFNRGVNTPIGINAGIGLDSLFNIGTLELGYTPAINIINNDEPQSPLVYITLTNKSGVPTAIKLKLFVVPLLPISKPEWVVVKRSVQSANDSNPYLLESGQSYLLGKSSRSVKPLRGSFKVYCLSDDIKIDTELLEPYHYYEYIYSDSLGEWVKINFKKRPRGLAAGEATNTSSLIFSGRLLTQTSINSHSIHYLKEITVAFSNNLPRPMINYIDYSAKLISSHNPVDQLIN